MVETIPRVCTYVWYNAHKPPVKLLLSSFRQHNLFTLKCRSALVLCIFSLIPLVHSRTFPRIELPLTPQNDGVVFLNTTSTESQRQ